MNDAARTSLNHAVARLSEGDRGAAPTVFAALWPPCLQLARAALGNDADAHDAAQAALMKLFAEASRFDPQRSALGWALALVTWECRTVQQQRRRRRVDDGADLDTIASAASVQTASTIERLDKAADVARVAAAFVQLDTADQATLQRLLDGEAAGEPRERKRRQRALDRLRALVLGPGPLGDDHG